MRGKRDKRLSSRASVDFFDLAIVWIEGTPFTPACISPEVVLVLLIYMLDEVR